MYCGASQDANYVDTADGPVTAIRNLAKVFPHTDKSKKRTVIIDRAYTSTALALRLLRMGFYVIGTFAKARIGFPDELKMQVKERPAAMPRGEYKIAVNNTVREVILLHFVFLFSRLPITDSPLFRHTLGRQQNRVLPVDWGKCGEDDGAAQAQVW